MYTEDQVIYELWQRGQISHKLHIGQLVIEEVFQRTTGKLFVLDIARQFGKTTWGAKICVETAIRKPGARIRCGAAFLNDIEQFIIPAFDLVMADIPKRFRPKWVAQKGIFVFPNKSTIRLVGLDRKPNGLRGNKLDLVFLDECGYISNLDYIYKFVLIPATTHVPDAKIIMASTQPESPDHDFIKYCDRAEMSGAYVKLTIEDNPLLSESQKEDIAMEYAPATPGLSRHERIRLGRLTTAFRREYMCERVVEASRAIIPEFNQTFHVKQTEPGPYHKFWHRYEALDSGVRDKTGWLAGYYDFFRAKVVIENEFTLVGHEVTTRRIAESIKELEKQMEYGTKYPVYRRVADNDNLILVQDLDSEFGLNFFATDKDELHAMINKVRMWMQAGRIEINPNCVQLIAQLRAGIWNQKRSEFERSAEHGHYDLIAALVYLIRNISDSTNPVPVGYGIDSSENVFIRAATSRDSESVKNLRKITGK